MNHVCAFSSPENKRKPRTQDMTIGQVARINDRHQFYMRVYDGFVPLNGAPSQFTGTWDAEVEEILPSGTAITITLG